VCMEHMCVCVEGECMWTICLRAGVCVCVGVSVCVQNIYPCTGVDAGVCMHVCVCVLECMLACESE